MMNKLLLCAMLILAAGCSKDDEPTNQNDQLVGTVWHQDINEYRAYTFYFAINGKCTESWKTSVGSGTLDLQRPYAGRVVWCIRGLCSVIKSNKNQATPKKENFY